MTTFPFGTHLIPYKSRYVTYNDLYQNPFDFCHRFWGFSPSFYCSKIGNMATDYPVRMHFCKECNNIMYPVEEADSIHGVRLVFKCKQCDFTEESKDICLFRINYKTESRSILNLVQDDVVDDPTLSRDENKECEECHQRGCVFFQAHGDGDDAMCLIFMCIHCKHKWLE